MRGGSARRPRTPSARRSSSTPAAPRRTASSACCCATAGTSAAPACSSGAIRSSPRKRTTGSRSRTRSRPWSGTGSAGEVESPPQLPGGFRMRKLFILFAMLTTALPSWAADPHPFNVRDLVTLKRISDPQASPRGDRIAFVLRSTDLAANRGRYDLWMVDAGGGAPVQLTTDPASDDTPRWAPDGRSLYFLSSRSGSNQVWRLAAGGSGA